MTEQHLEDEVFGHPRQHGRGRGDGPRRPRRHRRWIALLVGLVVVAAGGALAFTVVQPVVASLTEPNDFPGPGTGEVEVVVESGDSGRAIAEALADAGVVKTTDAFIGAVNDDPSSAAGIQPGAYTLRRHMSAGGALAILADPDNASLPRVTVPEGLWATEIYQRLSEGTDTPVKAYEKAARKPASLGLPPQAHGRLEGYLFPATYDFPVNSSAAEQLRMMVHHALDQLDAAGVEPGQMERTLTVASIIEGEVNGDADRAKVARVIENRLHHSGAPNYGLLQMDSTVHYAVHERGRAGTTDADRKTKSPYNTYLHEGLPPGPINNPGEKSIEAAAHPAKGPWLYFVTVNPNTGETRFSSTLKEHRANVAEFNQWCRRHDGSC